MTQRTPHVPDASSDRKDFRRRFAELQAFTAEPSNGEGAARFLALRSEFESLALPMRLALLGTPLAWTPEESKSARWLHRACDDFAALGYRLSARVAPRLGSDDGAAREVIAATLFYMGETIKWDISTAPEAPHDLRKVHTLMRLAMEGGRDRVPMTMTVDGRECDCTLESLYFRVLLLARYASGALNNKQIEILDAWMWLWMPVLSGVPDPPLGTALRADLDSAAGLQQGPRNGAGASLYLPQGPIEAAYRDVVAQFHAGRIVPSTGIASEFRIEEHVAVLDLVRRNLKRSVRAPVARAARRTVDRPVEIHVGLAEILKRGFAPSAPECPVSLATVDGKSGAARRLSERDTALGEIYDAERRMVHLVDESDTGFGLEGPGTQCGAIAAGDLLAVRLSADQPLVIGKVVRSVASRTPGRIFLGVRRLSTAAQLLDLQREPAMRPAEKMTLMFVAGRDSSGRHDACLVSERDFADRSPLSVSADNRTYTLRLNRARERGRGWVLAGFEVVAARPAWEFEVA